jgi:medium-chain acyl-[acyl-carrier-protein] hydrolase
MPSRERRSVHRLFELFHPARVSRKIKNNVTSTKWFVCPQPNLAAETRLFIFPHAGGSPAAFSKWTSGNIETYIAHYPGRGSRFNEPMIKKLDTLVENLLREIQPLLDKPFALFGHSMGGLIAYELARSLQHFSLPRPPRLFISACAAPQLPESNPPIHSLPEHEFLEASKKFNGVPAEISDQAEALNVLLPVLRADFEAVETYRFDPKEHPLDIPIIAFGGLDDERVRRERIEGWASQTNSTFKTQYFPGGHFFINTARDAVISSIAAEL